MTHEGTNRARPPSPPPSSCASRNETGEPPWPRFRLVSCLVALCSFLCHTNGNGNETERNSGTLAATERKRKRHKQHKDETEETERTAKGRTHPNNGRKPEQEGTAFPPFLPSFLPFFPFSVPFPFLFARKKNYFSAFTLCLRTFIKKSENKFVK